MKPRTQDMEALVEGETRYLPFVVLLAIAPTRALFDWKFKKKMDINHWSWFFLFVNLAFLFTFPLLKSRPGAFLWLCALLWAIPFSRICEISYAFYNDAIDQLEGYKPRSGLSRTRRIKMLGRSYFEISTCYATLYLALPDGSFAHPPANSFDSLYFSWITMTTTGFGDITPLSPLSRGLCMTEIGIGLMLIVFAVGTYLSYKQADS